MEPLQERCLQCGAELRGTGRVSQALAASWRRRLPWYPGDWIWPLLLLAVVTAASAAVALGAHSARTSSAPTFVATSTQAPVTSVATTAKTGTASTPQPTISTGTLPVAPGSPSTTVPTTPAPTTTAPTTTAPPKTTTAAPPPAPSGVASWPAGRSGYTDILISLPASTGRDAAVARAREAQRSGLAHVGVLLSSQYSSLHGGYWVVFAGVYPSQAAALAGLGDARRHGFAGAYPARVAP